MIPRVDRWIENTEQAFQSLAEKGHQWPSLEEVALQVRLEAHDRNRNRRSRAANSIIDLMGLGGRPTKPSEKFRTQTSFAIEDMKTDGLVECRFMDSQGNFVPKGAGSIACYRIVTPPEITELSGVKDAGTSAQSQAMDTTPRRHPGIHIM